MARYALKLPVVLKQEAETWARHQGASLNQFIVWAVAEKVGELKQRLDDPRFPQVAYRLGAAGWPTPVIRGSGLRVQALVLASRSWGLTPSEIAGEYGLSESQVREALDFYEAHKAEIDAAIAAEQELEAVEA